MTAKILTLAVGAFLLTYGLFFYRIFFPLAGAVAGLAAAIALRRPLLGLSAMAKWPGFAGAFMVIILVIVGAYLAARFRRALAFLGGGAAGAILFSAATAVWSGKSPTDTVLAPGSYGLMELLAGIAAGLLFLVLESFLAVLLTATVGAALCTWVIGGRWTFPVLLMLGLVAQPLLARRRAEPEGEGKAKGKGKGGVGPAAALVLLPALLVPAEAWAEWVVTRVNTAGRNVVLAAGKRQGVRVGEEYAVLDKGGRYIDTVRVAEVFADISYSQTLPQDRLERITAGCPVRLMTDYEYEVIRESGGEPRMEKYLARYPDSPHSAEVRALLDESRFNRAQTLNTVESWREFRQMNPGSARAGEALRREEDIAFSEALRNGTEEAFRLFLRSYPRSRNLSGIEEFRLYDRARSQGRIFAYQDFVARYPQSRLGEGFKEAIADFERWAHELEFGNEPVTAIHRLAAMADDAAIPLLVGKLLEPALGAEARSGILSMGPMAHPVLMEVLISPLQSVELKDQVALMLGEAADMTAIPAMRSYVKDKDTEAGRRALRMLEERAGK